MVLIYSTLIQWCVAITVAAAAADAILVSFHFVLFQNSRTLNLYRRLVLSLFVLLSICICMH